MIRVFILFALSFLVFSCAHVHKEHTAKNVIYMIVDGMGFSYIDVARIYNQNQPLDFENFTCKTKVTTRSLNNEVTDSAAAATAIATGYKVNNYAISQKGGEDLKTILEEFKEQNKATGIIATKLFSDATPAAFASHAKDRNDTDDILKSMFLKVKPNLIFGADNEEHRKYITNEYKIASNKNELFSLLSVNNDIKFLYGGFGFDEMGLPLEIKGHEYFEAKNLPHLSEMTDIALNFLSQNENGFFLMVESSFPDMIGHKNLDIKTLALEMMEVEKTSKVLRKFVNENPDTLLVLTADHETGGLVLKKDETTCIGQKECLVNYAWSQTYHTSQDVPLFAIGKGAENFCKEVIDNTEIKKFTVLE